MVKYHEGNNKSWEKIGGMDNNTFPRWVIKKAFSQPLLIQFLFLCFEVKT